MSQELLEKKNLSQLREIAKAYGIEKSYKYKKEELLELIVRTLSSEPAASEPVDSAELEISTDEVPE